MNRKILTAFLTLLVFFSSFAATAQPRNPGRNHTNARASKITAQSSHEHNVLTTDHPSQNHGHKKLWVWIAVAVAAVATVVAIILIHHHPYSVHTVSP